jgi:threonine dehydratase
MPLGGAVAGAIEFSDILRARAAIGPVIGSSPVRRYPLLDALVGHGIRVVVKHDNHLPVNTFKVRNACAALLRLDAEERSGGVIAASTGNHGQGLAWAGGQLGIPVTVCVPIGNNPEKNATIRSLGARLLERGASYDDCALECASIAAAEGLALVHSTNNAGVIAGAGTLAAEFLEQAPDLDALVLALGGGSQSVGAIIARDAMQPALEIYAVQSEGARAQHDAWHDGRPRRGEPAHTFAEGIACGSTYDFTFDTLRTGLTDFVLVREAGIAQGVRDLIRITHNLPEGAGAAGIAGVRALAPRLAGKTVGVVMCGGNMDTEVLRRILNGEL